MKPTPEERAFDWLEKNFPSSYSDPELDFLAAEIRSAVNDALEEAAMLVSLSSESPHWANQIRALKHGGREGGEGK